MQLRVGQSLAVALGDVSLVCESEGRKLRVRREKGGRLPRKGLVKLEQGTIVAATRAERGAAGIAEDGLVLP
jgi:hypothetical protein